MWQIVLMSVLAVLALSTVISPAQASEPTVVRYWFSMNDRQTAQLMELIPQFETTHANIRIQATRLDYVNFRAILLKSIVEGTFPDVARLDSLWMAEFADIEALDALDETIPNFAQTAALFFPGPLQTNSWHGHYWGVPQDTNTQVLFYHRQQFDALGLNTPQTVNEFVSTACALTDGTQHFGFAMSGMSFWAAAPLFYALGGQLTDPNGATAVGYLDSTTSTQVFQTFVTLYNSGCLAPTLLGGGPSIAEGFASGQYGMIFEGPGLIGDLNRMSSQIDVGLALIPAGPNGTSSVVGGSDTVLFADSKHKEAALQWINFLVSVDAQRAMAQAGALPTLRGLSDDPQLPRYLDIYMRQLETAQARPPTIHWAEIDHVLESAFRSMLLGQQSVQRALSAAAAEIDSLLVD